MKTGHARRKTRVAGTAVSQCVEWLAVRNLASERRDALGWKLELCADDLRAFRDTRSETIDGTHRPRHA